MIFNIFNLWFLSLELSSVYLFNTNCKMEFTLEFVKIFYSEGKDGSFSIETVNHPII